MLIPSNYMQPIVTLSHDLAAEAYTKASAEYDNVEEAASRASVPGDARTRLAAKLKLSDVPQSVWFAFLAAFHSAVAAYASQT